MNDGEEDYIRKKYQNLLSIQPQQPKQYRRQQLIGIYKIRGKIRSIAFGNEHVEDSTLFRFGLYENEFCK